jgi:proteasome accessory factor B
MPEKIKANERLLNLTLALLHTRIGLTKNEIFETVQGYKEEYRIGANRDNLERMFERDKKSLAETGIKYETFIPEVEDKNNQITYYRISRERFQWPSDTPRLTKHQIMLLNLAGRAWNHNSMSSEVARGLFKLRGLAELGQGEEHVGLAPRIRTHHPAFAPIAHAIEQGLVIEFSYRKPGETSSEKRRVQPWRLKNIDGQWLVTAWDEARDDVRNFLLQRIVPARVRWTDDEFTKPTEQALNDAENSLQKFIEDQVAVLKIKPNSRAWLHYGMDTESTTGQTEKQLQFMDLHLLAAELRHFGNDIEVISPAHLRDEIRTGLEKVASAHHD